MSQRSPFATLLWGLYLACSWTWCIGLYLPHILLDRFGWPGFLIFAAVNVIGASAFGFVVGTTRRSQDMVRSHGAAMRWFSAVTLAFHVFFLAYLCRFFDAGVSLPLPLVVVLPLGGLAAALVLSLAPVRAWPVIALVVYGLSIGTFVRIGGGSLGEIAWSGQSPGMDVLWTAPIIALGFLACPYLDLTFHRALQESNSRGAFVVFGVAFAVMLALSAAYWKLPSEEALRFVMAHMTAQSVFTMAAHLREVRQGGGGRGGAASTIGVFALPVVAVVIVPIVSVFENASAVAVDTYLRYLVFYGLAFPAYVLFTMTRGYGRPTARTTQMVMLLVIVLAPLCEAGFIHGEAWLLMFPVLVLLVVRAMRT